MVGSRHRKTSTGDLLSFGKGNSMLMLLKTSWIWQKISLEGLVKEVAVLRGPNYTLSKFTLC